MSTKWHKAAGLLTIILILAVMMTACDMGDDSPEVEEAVDLIVTADMSEVEEAINTSSEVSIQSVIEERFESFDLEIKIEHQDIDREEVDVSSYEEYDELMNGGSVEFSNLATGEWEITATLGAEYNEDDREYTIATEENEVSVTVEAGTTETTEITMVQEDGSLELEAGVGLDSLDELDTLELRDNGEAVKNYGDDGEFWTELSPRQYELYIKMDDATQRRSIMVLPGITKEVTIENIMVEGDFFEPRIEVYMDDELVSAVTEGDSVDAEFEVENTGAVAGIQDVTRRIEDPDGDDVSGFPKTEESVDLDVGDIISWEDDITLDKPGTYTFELETENDTMEYEVEVVEEPEDKPEVDSIDTLEDGADYSYILRDPRHRTTVLLTADSSIDVELIEVGGGNDVVVTDLVDKVQIEFGRNATFQNLVDAVEEQSELVEAEIVDDQAIGGSRLRNLEESEFKLGAAIVLEIKWSQIVSVEDENGFKLNDTTADDVWGESEIVTATWEDEELGDTNTLTIDEGSVMNLDELGNEVETWEYDGDDWEKE